MSIRHKQTKNSLKHMAQLMILLHILDCVIWVSTTKRFDLIQRSSEDSQLQLNMLGDVFMSGALQSSELFF